jgi:GH35 family endo-1,4-beta-xylanase
MHLFMACLVAGLASSASAGEPETDPDTHWRTAANARIEQIRKGDFTVRLLTPDGEPRAEQTLRIEQQRHHFLFGTAANAWGKHLPKYESFVLDHFNVVTQEDGLKWYSTERRKDQVRYHRADRFNKWARDNNLLVRGHCMFWSRRKFVQKWVQELPDEELRRRVFGRLEEVAKRYRGVYVAWDVNNEMLNGSFYADRLGADVRVEMFKKLHELDPQTPLYCNEYAILGDEEKTGQYIDMVRGLVEKGAPVGGIGIQEHACERFVLDRDAENPLPPDRTFADGPLTTEGALKTLDRFAEAFPQMPIQLTEVSCQDPDLQRRADGLEMLYRLAFSHPQVNAILLWGFHGRLHWLGGDKAGLTDRQGRLNPAGERISNMLRREWWTGQQELQTNTEGIVSFRGFYGTYRVEWQDADGKKHEAEVELLPDQKTVDVGAATDAPRDEAQKTPAAQSN